MTNLTHIYVVNYSYMDETNETVVNNQEYWCHTLEEADAMVYNLSYGDHGNLSFYDINIEERWVEDLYIPEPSDPVMYYE